MQKILVARPIFPDVIERLQTVFRRRLRIRATCSPADELTRRLADKDGALTAGDPVGAADSRRRRVCAWWRIWRSATTTSTWPAFNAADVLGTNTPDVLNESTADFGWALMMATARRITEIGALAARAAKWQKWAYDAFLGSDLHGSTLGVIGMGRIGQALARRAKGFNMQVIYHNRSRVAPEIEAELNAEYASKQDLLRRADHVVLVLPYTPENHHTIGAAELALMKPTATLTNIARGGIVDDAALVEALRRSRSAAAGLDVFEGEPNLNPDLLQRAECRADAAYRQRDRSHAPRHGESRRGQSDRGPG